LKSKQSETYAYVRDAIKQTLEVLNSEKFKTKGTDISDAAAVARATDLATLSGVKIKTEPEPMVTEEVQLSTEQKEILKAAKEKKSIFFSGEAGTGKSFVLKKIISDLRAMPGYSKAVFVTGPTALAASALGGVTIHSFSGVGLGRHSKEELAEGIKKNAKSKKKWIDCKSLIIDEISMLDGELFDKLEFIARKIRCNQSPFGGIQLICVGDFFQLPPVGMKSSNAKFAFEASTWTSCISACYELKIIHRQAGDPEFQDILREMRVGNLSHKSLSTLQKAGQTDLSNFSIEPTRLFSVNKAVDQINMDRLKTLKGESRTYVSRDSGNQETLKRLEYQAPSQLYRLTPAII